MILSKMKKKRQILIIVFCLILLRTQSSSQDLRSSFHAKVGGSFPKEGNIQAGFESGFGFSLSLGRKLSLSFDFVYWKSDVKERGGKLHNGTLSITPFLLSLQYSLTGEGFLSPYIFLGSGFVFSSFEIGGYISIPEIRINQKVKNGPAFYLGTGANMRLTRNLSFFGEISYLSRKAGAETIITDMNFGVSTKEFSIDLSSFLFGLGLKYFF